MAFELLVNDGVSALNGGIDSSQTTLVVDSASSFPTTGNFRIKIDNEIMLVTSVSTNTFTVTRNVESTSAASHADDAPVRQVLTKAGLDNYLQQNTWRPYKLFTPSGVDDEFNDDNFSGWTAVGTTPVPTTSEFESKLSIYHPGSDASSRWYCWMKSATVNVGDFVEICFRQIVVGDNYPIIGVFMADGTTVSSGAQVACDYSPLETQSFLRRITGYNTHSSQTGRQISAAGIGSHIFLRLYYTAANQFKTELSCDGNLWMPGIAATSLTLTPTHVGFGVTKWGGTQPALWALEYFRKGS